MGFKTNLSRNTTPYLGRYVEKSPSHRRWGFHFFPVVILTSLLLVPSTFRALNDDYFRTKNGADNERRALRSWCAQSRQLPVCVVYIH